jgi:hypothetical protein
MRKEKKIDLLDSDNYIVCDWNAPLSTDLKVVEGKMFEGNIDISCFFWDEIYWLYHYFNTQYENKYVPYEDSDKDSYDFISFRTYTERDYEYKIDLDKHPYGYSGKFCRGNFIAYWIMIQLK